jgi:hypothetical protein
MQFCSRPRLKRHSGQAVNSNARSNLEVDVKGRASLLKSLTRLDRYSRMCLARFDTDSDWALRTGDTDELAHTSREIIHVQSNMMKLFRELAAMSNQIRGLSAGKAPYLVTPASVDARGNHAGNNSNVCATEARQRFAFTAVITETGAMVVRVVADTAGICPQEEYGCFETWTEAQDFAAVLNQMHGIDPIEAQYIVVSANLALRSSTQAC